MKLYLHQQKIVDQNPHKHLLAHGMGTGKTITALALAQKNGIPPLVLCPKMLKEKWERTAHEMGIPCKVMTREEFRRDYKKTVGYRAVIVDEVHYGYSNMKSLLHKALYNYLKDHAIEFVWLLTGTPYTSTPMSVFSLARLIGHDWNFYDFRERFFVIKWLGNRPIWEPKEGIENELAQMVWKIGSIVRLDDCIDVPDQVIEEEVLLPTTSQKKKNKEVLLKEANPLARFTKYHQIASGALIGDEFTLPEEIDNEKFKRILEIAEENKKFIVFSRYNFHLNSMAKMLADAGYNCLIINGETKDKDAVVQKAEGAHRCIVLINTACSVGYELPSFDVTVYASLSFSFVDFEQSKGRTLRINNPHKNLYVVLLTKGSVDEDVWASIKKKQNFSEAIYAREGLANYEKGI